MIEDKHIEDPASPELTFPDGLLRNLLSGRPWWHVPAALACAIIMGREMFNRLEAIPPGYAQAVNYGTTTTENGITLPEFDSLLFQYFQKSSNFNRDQSFLAYPMANGQDIERIHGLGRMHTEYGLNLARFVLPAHEAASISVSEDKQMVGFMGRNFDMNHPLHPHILNALLGARMNLHGMGIQREELERFQPAWFIDEKGYRQSEANNLLWLYDQNLPIFVDRDAFAILPFQETVYLANMMRELYDLKIPFPNKISYVRWGGNGVPIGVYYAHGQPPGHRFTIVISNKADSKTIVHEAAHFVSDAAYLDPTNEALQAISQKSFEEQLSERFPVFVSIADIKPNDLVHEYSSAFEMYYLYGSEFRGMLNTSKRRDPYKHEVYSFEHDFMGGVFGGGEFFQHGLKGRRYAADSLVQINDQDTYMPGILMRVEIDSEFNPELPAVFHGDTVQIIGKSRILSDRYGLERNYWPIKVVSVGDKNKELTDGASLGAEGWLPDVYFMPVPS